VARYIATRLIGGLVTLFVASIVVFSLVRLAPGDPIAAVLGRGFNPEVAAELRQRYGLDQPAVTQYFSWLSAVLTGDLGVSFLNRASVAAEVSARIPRTLYLMVGGVLCGVVLGSIGGVIGAIRHNRWQDTTVTTIATALMAVPQFWLGILLIIVFSVTLGWLPANVWVDPSRDFVGSLPTMVLPWLTIGFGMSALVARVMRSSLLDVLERDYITTARSHGLSPRAILAQHALRNAAIPTVTVVGIEVGYLLGGSIVVEEVFAYPGMGQLIVGSIIARDYPMVQAAILFFAASFVVVNLLTDAFYAVLDPRMRAA
jgi:peptide/nickel transport system permease protein